MFLKAKRSLPMDLPKKICRTSITQTNSLLYIGRLGSCHRRDACHMRGPKFKMKSLLTICVLLISTSAIAHAQQKTVGSKQKAVGRSETRLSHTSLTRAQTKEAERRLSDMGYWTGAVDGLFDTATRSALIAFQKWEGRPITSRLTLDELAAIRTSTSPKAREPGYGHVEVDLDRQVLLLVND